MQNAMYFERRCYWLAKDLSHPGEYQDAFALDARRGLAAIADGVASSIFSRSWAQIVTRAAVEQTPDLEDASAFAAWLKKQRAAWQSGIDESKLAWHQKAKLREGASTTLLWIEMSPNEATDEENETIHLRSYAIGDCLLLHVRDREILLSFPLTTAAQFNANPQALGSLNLGRDQQIQFRTLETTCRPGDLLVLCTDAIGAWALAQQEAGSPPDWEICWEMDEDMWLSEINEYRQAGQMRYDDTTLVMLRLTDTPPEGGQPESIVVHPKR